MAEKKNLMTLARGERGPKPKSSLKHIAVRKCFDVREVITVMVLVAVFAVSWIALPGLPDNVPMHWDADGKVNGYGSPMSIFIMPAIAFFTYLALLALPYFSVRNDGVDEFYEMHGFSFKLVMVLFFAMMQVIILITAFGYTVPMDRVMPIGIGGLIAYIGWVIKDVKQNYFIGFRTPWALADKRVWQRTHALGSKAFIAAGAISIVSGLVGLNMLWSIAPVLLAAAVITVYSFVEYKRLQ